MAPVAITAGRIVRAQCDSPGNRPTASPSPMPITASTFGTLVSRKKATVRRAISSTDMPPRLSAHAPSASPPAPPVGNRALAPSSDMPTSQATRQLMRRQNTIRKTAT